MGWAWTLASHAPPCNQPGYTTHPVHAADEAKGREKLRMSRLAPWTLTQDPAMKGPTRRILEEIDEQLSFRLAIRPLHPGCGTSTGLDWGCSTKVYPAATGKTETQQKKRQKGPKRQTKGTDARCKRRVLI